MSHRGCETVIGDQYGSGVVPWTRGTSISPAGCEPGRKEEDE